jgi:hypothetical protein
VARFAGHGHLLISERGFADGARSLLQALTLRLATATRPGTVRFALADPVGQGRYLSAFLRLPAQLRVGAAGGLRVGVAASPAETEALLTTLTSHVVDVTQTRLTNVYDSVETYNAATTGATVPYHVLVLAGFPAGISDRAGGLLGRLARNGPRSGLYIIATVDPGLDLPRGFDLAGLTALGTTVSLDDRGDLSWDDPDFAGSVIEPDQMPGAAQANPWLDAVGAAAGSAWAASNRARASFTRAWRALGPRRRPKPTAGTGAKSSQSGAGSADPSGPGSNRCSREAASSRSKVSGRSGRTPVSTSPSAFIRPSTSAVCSSAARCRSARCSCWRSRSVSFSRCRRSRASRSSSRRCAARRCSHAARLPIRAMAPLVCARTATE